MFGSQIQEDSLLVFLENLKNLSLAMQNHQGFWLSKIIDCEDFSGFTQGCSWAGLNQPNACPDLAKT